MAGLQDRQPEERLHRKVELAPEAAARSRRHNSHLLLRKAQNARGIVPVHDRGLRASLDRQSLAV